MKQRWIPILAAVLLLLSPSLGEAREKKVKPPKKVKVDTSRCPNNCNRHGLCGENGCVCDPGYTGGGCKTKLPVYKAPKGQ